MSNILKTIKEALMPSAPNTLHVFAEKFAETRGGPIIAADSFKQIKALESEWRDAWRDKNERYTTKAANDEYKRQITSGKPEEPDGFKNLLSEYEARTARAELKMTKIAADSMPLVTSILKNFIEAGETWIDKRLKSEKAEAAEYGIGFAPSQILLSAQRLIASYKIRTQNITPYGRNPLTHLPFLNLD